MSMKRFKKWYYIVPAVIVLAPLAIALFVFLGGGVVMLLWNWLLPPLFGWREVTFWQALGLLALCRILFGGFGRVLRCRLTFRAFVARQFVGQIFQGIGRLALESGAAVVPVAIHGSAHVRNWKRGQFPKVRVRYGDAVIRRFTLRRPSVRKRPSRRRRSASCTSR